MRFPGLSIKKSVLALITSGLVTSLLPIDAQETVPNADPTTVEEATEATENPTPEPEPVEAWPKGDVDLKASDAMKVFSGHVGQWKGLTKAVITEGKEKLNSTSRSEWRGGYTLEGKLFQIIGFLYGDAGRQRFQWQYSYDDLKARYMASYHDSQGRTQFFEGRVNDAKTKIVWRLLAAPGDMIWTTETDLNPADGIEVTDKISSSEFSYEMEQKSVFKRPLAVDRVSP